MYTLTRPLPVDVQHLWHEIEAYKEDMVHPPGSLSELVSLWGTSWCIFTGTVESRTGAWFILTDPTYYSDAWNSAGLTLVVLPEYRGKHALELSHLFLLQVQRWGFRRLWTNCKTPQSRKMARLCRFTWYAQEKEYVVYELNVQEYSECPLTRQARPA